MDGWDRGQTEFLLVQGFGRHFDPIFAGPPRPRIRDRHPAFRDVTQHGLESHVLHKDAWEVLKATGVVEGAELASTEDVESFLAGRRIHSSKPCVCLVGDANLRHMFARKSRNQVKCLKQDTYWKHLLYYIIRDPLQPAVGHA